MNKPTNDLGPFQVLFAAVVMALLFSVLQARSLPPDRPSCYIRPAVTYAP